MKNVDAVLFIYGDGNILNKIKKLIATNKLHHKIQLKGKVLPEELDEITSTLIYWN